jgi:hypothetical protein
VSSDKYSIAQQYVQNQKIAVERATGLALTLAEELTGVDNIYKYAYPCIQLFWDTKKLVNPDAMDDA